MTKGRSKQSSGSGDDLSLPKDKILRGRKNFKRLFENEAQVIRNQIVDLRFQILDMDSSGCFMGFIVKKSLGKAHKRNHMKRLLKEAYRHHQHILSKPVSGASVTFHGAFMAKVVDATYADVEKNVIALLSKVRDQLSPGHS
ncbi:ribonuclease P protein component [Fodinibius sp. Rm-B-1B1-1]|uniref:ribonuclease P protein component n=1 Tax=Fodinibius alkaliphilus TaxID=3140241 RepID=UPI003159DEBB